MGHAARNDHEVAHLEIEYTPGMLELFSEVSKHLTEAGRREFTGELASAVFEGMRTKSSRHVNDVLQAWYRTLLFKRANVDAAIEQAEVEFDPADAMTEDEVREFFSSR